MRTDAIAGYDPAVDRKYRHYHPLLIDGAVLWPVMPCQKNLQSFLIN